MSLHEAYDLYAQSSSDHSEYQKMCYQEIVNLIKQDPSTLNDKNHKGNTVIHKASKDENLQIICLFLKNGAQVDIKNNKRKTPLHSAAQHKNYAVIEILIAS